MSLFRKAVLDHKKNQSFGSVLYIHPPGLTILAWCAVAILIALGLLLGLGVYTPKQTVLGHVVSNLGVAKIYSPSPSTLSEILVQEGDQVKVNQILLTGRYNALDRAGEQTDAQLLQALSETKTQWRKKTDHQALLFSQKQAQVELKTQQFEQEQGQINQQLMTMAERVQLSFQKLDKLSQLVEQGSAPSQMYQDEQSQHLQLLQQQETLQYQAIQLESARMALLEDARRLPLEHQDLLFDLNQRWLEARQREIEVMARGEYQIPASMTGEVTAINAKPGQTVSPQTLLMTIVPEGAELEAALFLPARAIGFIQVGQTVNIRYTAFPYQKFGVYQGRVRSISKTILSPQEILSEGGVNEPVYQVMVALNQPDVNAYGRTLPLHLGMQLEADILLDKRRLIEWVLSPLFSFKGAKHDEGA